jgi:hypothetical protein
VFLCWRYEVTENGPVRSRPIWIDEPDEVDLSLRTLDYVVFVARSCHQSASASEGTDK